METDKSKGGRPKGSGEKYNKIYIRISDELKEKLKKYADKHKMTMTEAIEQYIKGLPVD
ncbi:MAG TPA: CopG family transcriptional regulator [Cyanophyceae cyanobacterium]